MKLFEAGQIDATTAMNLLATSVPKDLSSELKPQVSAPARAVAKAPSTVPSASCAATEPEVSDTEAEPGNLDPTAVTGF